MDSAPLVVHDFFTFPGGGERLARTLAKGLGAVLWGAEVDVTAYPPGFFTPECSPRSLRAFARAPFWLRPSDTARLWWAFAKFPSCSPPWTVFSGSLSLLAHKRIPGKKILYCHTPPRMLYDQRKTVLGNVSKWRGMGLRALMAFYDKAFKEAVADMDGIVANSANVQARIKHYLGLESRVVHPPIDTQEFQWLGQEDFYLSPGRLDPLKRVERIVRAFVRMPDKKLVLISGGSEENRLQRLAKGAANIRILGWVGEKRLKELMGKCIATVYIPVDEDFGMSPVESMAAGKPVIGVQEGGLWETVGLDLTPEDRGGSSKVEGEANIRERTDGQGKMLETECGVLVPPDPGVEDIIQAVRYLTPKLAGEKRGACEQRASGFDSSIFLHKMQGVISSLQ